MRRADEDQSGHTGIAARRGEPDRRLRIDAPGTFDRAWVVSDMGETRGMDHGLDVSETRGPLGLGGEVAIIGVAPTGRDVRPSLAETSHDIMTGPLERVRCDPPHKAVGTRNQDPHGVRSVVLCCSTKVPSGPRYYDAFQSRR